MIKLIIYVKNELTDDQNYCTKCQNYLNNKKYEQEQFQFQKNSNQKQILSWFSRNVVYYFWFKWSNSKSKREN
ncbi:hypothetical protein TTHERM_00326750 (macronuclear) [Tetrahymena thermophila SB210]|uniref:Uncharacterized protein n=1 Tax=Tetrahymena thermophila (strain SB210) TaxID=312017 RepID=I7MJE1_TETTS|nr:hypothetical protein TTHERM_00326750 [Tetrahymena thermophila SB210]EAS06193.1 hypothetical protein TTHERM_00326750 [Tetrahymena thermophila SB210]|eukprot:XP_001026438.1 hypothetical protein TTHERM_00326750 [Tetrahymena thermophila SB210]